MCVEEMPDYDQTRSNLAIVVGQKPGVEVEEHAVAAAPERTGVAPFSVSIYDACLKMAPAIVSSECPRYFPI
jgi:hypothetical protein